MTEGKTERTSLATILTAQNEKLKKDRESDRQDFERELKVKDD